MLQTDRLTNLGAKSVALGAFIIAYIQWGPKRIADLLNSPTYIGYLISLQFALLVVLIFGVIYMISHVTELREEIEDDIDQSINYYLSRIEDSDADFLDDSQSEQIDQEDEDIATDGGSSINSDQFEESDNTNQKSDSDMDQSTDKRSILIRRFSQTTKRGMLIGIVVGLPLGLLHSLDATVFGGILGGIIGNEIEYQAIRYQHRSERKKRLFEQFDKNTYTELANILQYRHVINVIKVLDDFDSPISLTELTERIIYQGGDELVPERTPTDSNHKRVYATLYQTHIPNLHNAGVVKFDRESNQVEKGDRFQQAVELIDNITLPEESSLSRVQVLDILSNERRMATIEELLKEDKSVSLSELAETIAAREADKDRSQISSAEHKSVYVSLYQTHLPKLSDFDVIEFDKNRGTIKKGPELDNLSQSLEFEQYRTPYVQSSLQSLLSGESYRNESVYYILISIVAMIIVLANQFGVRIISNIETNIWFSIYTILVLLPILLKLSLDN